MENNFTVLASFRRSRLEPASSLLCMDSGRNFLAPERRNRVGRRKDVLTIITAEEFYRFFYIYYFVDSRAGLSKNSLSRFVVSFASLKSFQSFLYFLDCPGIFSVVPSSLVSWFVISQKAVRSIT